MVGELLTRNLLTQECDLGTKKRLKEKMSIKSFFEKQENLNYIAVVMLVVTFFVVFVLVGIKVWVKVSLQFSDEFVRDLEKS